MDFGGRIKELRKAQTRNQRDLAESVGIDFTYPSKIENGRMEPPSEDVIRRIAKELGANPDELIVLASRFPSDLAQELKTPERVSALRRDLAGDFLSAEDFRRAFGQRRLRRSPRTPPPWGGASAPRSLRRVTQRRSSATASSPGRGSTRQRPKRRSGYRRCAAATSSFWGSRR